MSLAFGVATQALFWRTGIGLNFFLWAILAAMASLASVQPRRLTPVAACLVLSSVLLAFSVVRFASSWALYIAAPSTVLVVGFVPLALRDGTGFHDAARLPLDVLRSLRNAPAAAHGAARMTRSVALGGHVSGRAQVLKGLLLGLPITGLFALLLAADADFRALLGAAGRRFSNGVAFASWAVVTAALSLVLHVLYAEAEEAPASGVLGRESAYRVAHAGVFQAPCERRLRPKLAPSTWAVVLAQVSTVFLGFAAVNFRTLFGGDALIHAPGSLTYANYLHAGFGQLLIAASLSVCLVVVGHRLVATGEKGAEGAPAPTVAGLRLALLECTLLALTGVALASSAQRLVLYEDAYGATRLRLGVFFIILTVAGALALTATKSVRRGWRSYGSALAALFLGVLLLASGFNADAYIARTNLDRAARGKPLDLAYLASLSSDASPVLSHPYLSDHPAMAEILRVVYAHTAEPDWRARRGLGR
jgi:hypothetical protein